MFLAKFVPPLSDYHSSKQRFLQAMGFLMHASLLLLSIVTITNALVLPRQANSTLPDSGCLNTDGGSCESNWDRIPTAVKAIIFIAAFIALGGIVAILQRFKLFAKNLMPSWMRSGKKAPKTPKTRPPTQRELVACWEKYGARQEDGWPAAATQEELVDLWRSRNDDPRFVSMGDMQNGIDSVPLIRRG